MRLIVLLNEREVVAVRGVGVFVLVDLRSQICGVGESYVDEPLVGTEISPQIG